jgi:uncharacterized cupin superfamily protein
MLAAPAEEVAAMSLDKSSRIRVVKPQDVVWEEAATYPEETDPPGSECTVAESTDERFSCGLWQRDVQRRYFERPYHEIAFIIEGQVEVTDDDGNLVVAGPGDVLITPKGSKGYWKSLGPVKKFWAIYDDPGNELNAYLGAGGF